MDLVINWDQGSKSFGPTDTVTVGRSQQCAIVLDYPSVSRTHVTISYSDGQWRYQDSSSNGTFSNGQKSPNGQIGESMSLRIGSLDGPSISLEPETAKASPVGVTSDTDATVAANPSLLNNGLDGNVSAPPAAPIFDAPAPPEASVAPTAPIFDAPTPPEAPVAPTAPAFSEPPVMPTPRSASGPSRFDPPVGAPDVPGNQFGSNPPAAPEAPSPVSNSASAPPMSSTPPSPPPAGPIGGGVPQSSPVGAPPSGPSGGGGKGGPAAPGGESLPDHSASFGGSAGAGEIQLDDRMLRLELDGKTGAFHPSQQVTVGRDPANNMTSNSQSVSRSHCRFTHDGTSWWIEDVGSSRGTYIGGRRVAKRQQIQGAFNVSLGDDDAGDQMRVITGGHHKRKENKAPLILAAAALAAVTVIGVLAFALWPDTSSFEDRIAASEAASSQEIAAAKADFAAQAAGANGNTPEQLQNARLATGMIYVFNDEEPDVLRTGSGAIVSEDGLILTNLHVALPGTYFERTGNPALSTARDGNTAIVGFTSIDGGTVDRFYMAEQVAPHPGHDAALLQIVPGDPFEDLPAASMDLLPEPLEFATSSTLKGGDQIAVVGYPGLARQNSETTRVSVSINNFQSFTECRINSDWGCQQDYSQGLLNIAGETLEGGSSGGPIIRFGKIVGIQMGVRSDVGGGGTSGQDQGVPSDVVLEGFPQLLRPTE